MKNLIVALLILTPLFAFSQEFKRNTFDYDRLESDNFPDCEESVISTLQQSFIYVEQNNSASAVENAKSVYDKNKNCFRVFEAYGYSLFRNGKWLEGIAIIEEGIEKFGSVPELIKRKSEMSIEMAYSGTGRRNIDGSAVYKPNVFDYDEEQFVQENYRSALADLNYLMINYQRSEEIFYVAKIHQILEQYEKSTDIFSQLLDNEDYKYDAILNIADNYIVQGKLDEAEENLLSLLKKYPRLSVGYEKLADIYNEKGDDDQAQAYRKKAIFYDNVPDYLDFPFSDENFDLLLLFGTDDETPEVKMSKLDELYKAGDAEFTTDICLIILKLHANHGNGVEEKATEVLNKIGEPAIQKVHQLFQDDVSTCTITNLSDVMATVKDEESWELMKAYLAYIANMPMTLIPPNIPQKMVDFDEKRGVEEILRTVQPLLAPKEANDDPMASFGGFGQYVYYVPLKDMKRSKVLKTAKKLGYSDEELELLKEKLD